MQQSKNIQVNSARRILGASLIGTTIEIFDFYIYATAAVLVFPKLFYPAGEQASATLQSLATFSLAFFARPIGSAIFGHFGDRVGRKTTLVASLLTMGLSTMAIGTLPTYDSMGYFGLVLLMVCRIGQGLGLGGEWGGAVLLATENAPPGRRAWYGMFPQLGSPLGFFLSTGLFLWLSYVMDEANFLAWGWRVPFLASGLLVILGLWMRLNLHETEAFSRAMAKQERARVPLLTVLTRRPRALLSGCLASLATLAVSYLITVFSLSWATTHMGYTRGHFLLLLLPSVLFFALTIPLSALFADRHGRSIVMLTASVAIFIFGIFFAQLFEAGFIGVLLALALGMCLMGISYGPLGTMLAEMFPTAVRYTGASLAFNLASILGASLTPYLATVLASSWGLWAVGYYLSVSALLAAIGILIAPRAENA